jgi:hypothetical protein
VSLVIDVCVRVGWVPVKGACVDVDRSVSVRLFDDVTGLSSAVSIGHSDV